jgi:pimeloyl-ACP methyl ester carboxylesterase
MPRLAVRGVELAWSERGQGAAVLLVHETGTASGAWSPVAEAIAERARAISYDRRGWGESSAPDDHHRTTVEEHSEDAAALIEALEAPPAVLCGAGIGAVIALDLLLRRPDLVAGAVLIEPPLLGLVPRATEALSADRKAAQDAARAGGVAAVVELYLSGGLAALGPGVERLPEVSVGPARRRPQSLVAELGAIPGWSMPLVRLGSAERPSAIVVSAQAPPLFRDAAGELRARLGRSELRELEGAGPPHLTAPAELARIGLELA